MVLVVDQNIHDVPMLFYKVLCRFSQSTNHNFIKFQRRFSQQKGVVRRIEFLATKGAFVVCQNFLLSFL
jgi:hypothetical protein